MDIEEYKRRRKWESARLIRLKDSSLAKKRNAKIRRKVANNRGAKKMGQDIFGEMGL
jgi:hypothetical protein